MDNEFEFENLEELEDMFEEFEDLDEFAEFEIEARTAILAKNDMIALLCLRTAGKGAAICRIDPREDRPAVQLYEDAESALDWYNKSLRTSRQNGWTIAYDGLPLRG